MNKFLKLFCSLVLVLVASLVLIGCGEEETLSSITIKNSKDLTVGDNVSLTVSTTPANMVVDVEWKSSDSSIATVSINGLVKGLAAGTVEITAKVKDNTSITDKVTIIVTNKEDAVLESIAITNSKNLILNEEVTLSYTTTPANMTAEVEWSTSDESIASVSSSGVVKALKVGSVEITAKVKDSTITAKVTITVTESQEKVFSGYNISVENADVTNLLGTGKLYVTSFGQADRDYVQEIVDEAIAGSDITYTFDNQLMAANVEAGSLVIAVVGFTSKGISGNITQTGEIKRAEDFAAKNDINLVIVQLDGKARRGASSDPIISAAVAGAEYVLIYDNNTDVGADYDGFYTGLCTNKHLFKFSDEFEMYTYIAAFVGLSK